MASNESGAIYEGPIERRTASEYSYSAPKEGRGNGVPSSTVNNVFAELKVKATDGQNYVSANDFTDLDETKTALGKSLRELADDEHCPIELERWSGETSTPAKWKIVGDPDV